MQQYTMQYTTARTYRTTPARNKAIVPMSGQYTSLDPDENVQIPPRTAITTPPASKITTIV